MTDDPEPILDPGLPIVDAHHHLWDFRPPPPRTPPSSDPFVRTLALTPRYFIEEFAADAGGGHDVRASVFVECRAMWRADGPEPMRPVGETEFVSGVAAMSASGGYGPARLAAGIVGHADLRLGAAVAPVLEAYIAAGGGRFRGVRHTGAWNADPQVLGVLNRAPPGLFADAAFRAGFAQLAPLGLSFDAWVLEPQLGEVRDLARAFPETTLVLDHLGTPLGVGAYAGRRDARFADWRAAMVELAALPNVVVKLGGLAMTFCGFDGFEAEPAWSSQRLADQWRPWVETCVEAFGVDRCLFESNFPVDRATCGYRTLWNAFKRLAQGASQAETAALFGRTAARVYRLDVDLERAGAAGA